ncbi:MAG: glutamine synthetase family protein, partial [Pseudomonadota bacterium]
MTAAAQLVVASDIHGLFRGKRLAPGVRAATKGDDLKMPLSVLFPDVWGRDLETTDHLMRSGDLDGTLQPIDRAPLSLAPWQPELTLQLATLLTVEGAPYPVDPRQALAAILQQYRAKGLNPVCAIELEFYLYDPNRQPLAPPKRPSTGTRLTENDVYALDDIEAFAPFFDVLYARCESAGIALDAAIAEYGRGQFEVNLKHGDDALRVADDAQIFKYLVRRVAQQFGLGATFMAKPLGSDLGNGMHVHWSLLDAEGANVFAADEPTGSATLKAAVAGMLAALPESMLILAPHFNSYRRFTDESLAPTRVSWGVDNRTVALRIPDSDAANRRVEHRVAGADANPYLTLTALLGAGLMG